MISQASSNPHILFYDVTVAQFPSPSHPVTPANSGTVAPRPAPVRHWLENLFRCREVDRDPRLKIICATLLFYFFLTFFDWWHSSESLSTQGNQTFNYAPAAIFQNLRWLIFMDVGQTKIYLYALGMLALLGLFSLFYLRSSLLAMGLLAFLWANKLFFYLCDIRLFHNFHHFHLFFTLVFLLSRDKLRFFRAALAVGYVMSAVVKISPSWLQGEYFNSLPDKLPLLPKISWVVTATSIGVFVMEFFGPWAWFTTITWLRRLTFGLFILFHLYSGVLIAFWYTALMVPLVVAAFLRFNRPLQAGWRFHPRHLAPLGIIAFVILSGLYHYCLPGDVRLTYEGRYFGFFMFDANRQITFETEIQKGDKTWDVQVFRPFLTGAAENDEDGAAQITGAYFEDGYLRTKSAVVRPIEDGGQVVFNPEFFAKLDNLKSGDPYLYYFFARELMRRYHPDRVSLRLEVQLNGHIESVRLLDIPDFGKLNPTYSSFKHNDWITLPDATSPAAYRWP